MARKTLVALYDGRPDAEAAQRTLLDAGFDDLVVDVVADGGFGGANDGHGGLFSLLNGWGVPEAEAHDYAEAVRQGGALLVVSVIRVAEVDRALSILEPGLGTGNASGGGLAEAASALRAAAKPLGPDTGGDAPAPPPERRAGVYPATDPTPRDGQGRTMR